MSYTLHAGAEQDVAKALDFYLRQAGVTVAERFLDEFERAADLVVKQPGLGTPVGHGRRSLPLRIFPYVLVYLDLGSSVRILVVRHQHRRPSHGGGRR
ncbi:type II toxin-antitoxin system RelE/ParE family toxin [Paucibacter sp. O1-1]|nr:type II toxin-antitoxin system RelE/ParE family toxin [Paucibacter sp. O1-1]MDA3829564.1 type II toxin-antitoxin system RelE/ParE family toxin [Paucibacter sp. O1-1]